MADMQRMRGKLANALLVVRENQVAFGVGTEFACQRVQRFGTLLVKPNQTEF